MNTGNTGRMGFALAGALALVGCSHAQQGVARVETPGVQGERMPVAGGLAIRNFVSDARDVGSRPGGHVDALRSMASAIQALPEGRAHAAAAAESILAHARALESGPEQPKLAEAKQALMDAAGALDEARPRMAGLPEYGHRIYSARDAIDQIDEAQPYLDQRAQIDTAISRLADAFAVVLPDGGASMRTGQLPTQRRSRQPVSGHDEALPPQPGEEVDSPRVPSDSSSPVLQGPPSGGSGDQPLESPTGP